MSDVKLLPCPFCGREPVLTKMGYRKEYRPCVSCESKECPVGPCTDGFVSAEEASAAWNTRATDHARIVAEKDAEIQRLRKALARYKDVQDGSGSYSAGAEGGKVASLRENHPFGSIYDALRKTEAERDKFNASNERLNADHACIVAEKDAEIQRLREALEKARKCLTELYPSEPCQAEHANEYYAVNAVINAADAALNPPQQKDGECA